MDTVTDFHALLEAPATKETARASLEQLRQARIDGHVADVAFSKRQAYLLALEGGQDVQPPAFGQTMQEHVEQVYAESMKPGEPHEYKIEYPPMTRLDDDQLAFDTEVRQALSDGKVPAHLGGPIVERIERLARELGPLDDEARGVKLESMRQQLRKSWGADYQKRSEAIADYVAAATGGHEAVGELLDKAGWALLDPAVSEWLWSVVEFQSRK